MSAFIVSQNHLKAIVIQSGVRNSNVAEEYIDVLHRENVRSVNHRYSDAVPVQTFTVSNQDVVSFDNLYTPIQALKLCDSLEYQSCETPDYYKTEAYKLLKMARATITRKLPGYEEAEWAI